MYVNATVTAPLLVVLAGLPGSGKSTIARALAGELGATWLRIDTIEQGLRELCEVAVEGEGYELAWRIAADQLLAGTSVVADSVNPIALTRARWRAIGAEHGARTVDVEVCCSDDAEHRRRVETRESEVPGLRLPSWADVQARQYETWDRPPLRVDTATRSPDVLVAELVARLRAL